MCPYYLDLTKYALKRIYRFDFLHYLVMFPRYYLRSSATASVLKGPRLCQDGVMELRGHRVLLRPFVWEDAPQLFEIAQDEELARYTYWYPHRSIEDSYQMLQGYVGAERFWAIELEGQLAGSIALLVNFEHQTAEIATWLGRAFWGSGANREAKTLVLDYAFWGLRVQRVESITHVENTKAQRGLEKMGFLREGVLRRYRYIKGWHWDMVMYAIMPEEWAAQPR